MPTHSSDNPHGAFWERLLGWLRRRWLLVVVIIAFVVFVLANVGEIERVVITLLGAQEEWVLVAIGLQTVYYFTYTLEYRLGFAAVEVQSRVLELIPVLFASIFVKAVVPTGGVSSLAVFVDDATRRGQSGARAAEGALLVLVADLIAITPLVLLGAAFLAIQSALRAYQVLTILLFLLFAAALTGVILLGRSRPRDLRRLFEWAEENINWLVGRIRHHPVLPEGWADKQATQYIEAARSLDEEPRLLGALLGVTLFDHLVNLSSLYALSIAFRYPLSLSELIAAFGLNFVFSVISITPHGIGVAEGVMSLVLISLGVPSPQALAITISFRGLNVWLPLAIGFVFLRQVRALGGGGGRRDGSH